MPRSGNTYTAPASSFNPAVGSTTISSTDWNALLADLAAAMSDSTSFAAAQAQAYIWGGIAGGTANALTLSLSPALASYTNGLTFRFYTGASPNTAGATLAINGLTAFPINLFGLPLSANQLQANTIYQATFYNSVFHLFPAVSAAPVIVGGTSNLVGQRNPSALPQIFFTADEVVMKNTAGIPKLSALSAYVDISLSGVSGLDTGSASASAVTCTNATDLITWVGSGLAQPDGVIFSAAVMPTGLTAGTLYYARDIAGNDFKVSATPNGAAINFTTDGTTVVAVAARHFYVWSIDRTTPVYGQSVTVDASTDRVTYTAHGFAANTPVQFAASVIPTGLTAGTTYFIRDVTANDFKLAATPNGAAINITTNGTSVTLSTTPALILSLSSTSPTLPTGYTYSAMISTTRYVTTTDLREFYQTGREIFISPESVFAGRAASVANTYESAIISGIVPPNAKIISGRAGSTDTVAQTSIMVAAFGGAASDLGAMGHNADGATTVIDTYAGVSGFRIPKSLTTTMNWKSAVITATSSIEISGYVI